MSAGQPIVVLCALVLSLALASAEQPTMASCPGNYSRLIQLCIEPVQQEQDRAIEQITQHQNDSTVLHLCQSYDVMFVCLHNVSHQCGCNSNINDVITKETNVIIKSVGYYCDNYVRKTQKVEASPRVSYVVDCRSSSKASSTVTIQLYHSVLQAYIVAVLAQLH